MFASMKIVPEKGGSGRATRLALLAAARGEETTGKSARSRTGTVSLINKLNGPPSGSYWYWERQDE